MFFCTMAPSACLFSFSYCYCEWSIFHEISAPVYLCIVTLCNWYICCRHWFFLYIFTFIGAVWTFSSSAQWVFISLLRKWNNFFQINIVTSIFIENCWNLFYIIDNSQKSMPYIFWSNMTNICRYICKKMEEVTT